MTAYLRVYTGPCGVGLGHITRCEAIASELSSRGCDILFSSYLDGVRYLERTQWRYVSSPPISFRTREDGTIDTKLTATQNGVTVGLWKFVKQVITELRAIINYNPHVIVSDTRASTLLAGYLLRKPTVLVINQYSVQMPRQSPTLSIVDRAMLSYARFIWKYGSTLLGLTWSLSDVIAIPDFEPPYTVSKYNLTIPKRVMGKVRHVGPISPLTMKNVERQPAGRPMVFACISGPANDRRYLVRVLQKMLPRLPQEVEVILSCGDPKGSTLPKRKGRMTIYDWLEQDDYYQTFRRADVVVARAGHGTVMMGLAQGKRMILIPPPNHTEQANNARRAEELGAAVVLDQTNLRPEMLVEAINRLLETGPNHPFELRAANPDNGILKITQILFEVAGRTTSTPGRPIEPIQQMQAQ